MHTCTFKNIGVKPNTTLSDLGNSEPGPHGVRTQKCFVFDVTWWRECILWLLDHCDLEWIRRIEWWKKQLGWKKKKSTMSYGAGNSVKRIRECDQIRFRETFFRPRNLPLRWWTWLLLDTTRGKSNFLEGPHSNVTRWEGSVDRYQAGQSPADEETGKFG